MSYQEKRKYYRIKDTLAFEYQVLSPKEYEAEKIRFWNQVSGVRTLKNKYAHFLPNELDMEYFGAGELSRPVSELIRGLVKLIIGMNEKVDLILSHLEDKEDVSIYQKHPEDVSLSAEGIGFYTSESLSAETQVKIRMLLPQNPQILITTLGRVVRVTAKQIGEVKRFEVGILFSDIHGDDQEAIINHVFTRQRDILRNKAKS
ncbi:MAG: PilZ domain-containing protein [bacterium]